jgi:hypothetical protein
MTRNIRMDRTLAFVALFALGCSGSGAELGNNPDGGIGNVDGGGERTELDGAACVDIVLSSYDQSCTTSSDCIEISSGEICSNNGCRCGGSTINQSGEARYEAAIPAVAPGAFMCGCPRSGTRSAWGAHASCAIPQGRPTRPAAPTADEPFLSSSRQVVGGAEMYPTPTQEPAR